MRLNILIDIKQSISYMCNYMYPKCGLTNVYMKLYAAYEYIYIITFQVYLTGIKCMTNYINYTKLCILVRQNYE